VCKVFQVKSLNELDPSVKSVLADLEAKAWAYHREVEASYMIVRNLFLAIYENTQVLIMVIVEGSDVSLAEYWKAVGR